ncbi:hypothetical protein SAMN03159488_02042 [Pseudomonas sp. NFIX10]|nr:hypothetical protein SAMN03159488_02042 [Pseudomonas sp. NFIX10]SFE68032.1 hypothetical protein SAMN03159367_01835 [Pseudomonas sp. NFACC06-1]
MDGTPIQDVYIQVPIRKKLSLYGDAFDLHEKARASQFTDTYACPCTSAPGKDLIFHAPESWHMAVHIDVISGHFDDIFKFAATGFQDEPKIFPCCQKLLLGVFDNC